MSRIGSIANQSATVAKPDIAIGSSGALALGVICVLTFDTSKPNLDQLLYVARIVERELEKLYS